MKLIRFGDPHKEKSGILLEDGRRLDVSSFGEDYTETFFETDGMLRLEQWLEHKRDNSYPGGFQQLPEIEGSVRLGPPVCRPGKIVCIGFNYLDHARESGKPVPPEPVFFLKSPSALSGPNDDVRLPRTSKKTDWEVELAVVVKKKASYVQKDTAMEFIAGFVLFNDYSEREFQFHRGGQWVKGKSADTFAPLGPFLASPDEIRDHTNLNMWLKVNGEFRQKSNTSNMIFDLPTIISSVTQYMTLLAGDILCTGTPAGVGYGRKPPEFLKKGDFVEYGIDGLGSASQSVIEYDDV